MIMFLISKILVIAPCYNKHSHHFIYVRINLVEAQVGESKHIAQSTHEITSNNNLFHKSFYWFSIFHSCSHYKNLGCDTSEHGGWWVWFRFVPSGGMGVGGEGREKGQGRVWGAKPNPNPAGAIRTWHCLHCSHVMINNNTKTLFSMHLLALDQTNLWVKFFDKQRRKLRPFPSAPCGLTNSYFQTSYNNMCTCRHHQHQHPAM